MIVGLTVLRQLLRKSIKLLPPELLLLAQICTKSFVGWDFASDPTGGAYSSPPYLLAGLRGPISKGMGGKGRKGRGRVLLLRGGEVRRGRGGEGSGKGKGRGKGGRGWPDQSQTHCYGSVLLPPASSLTPIKSRMETSGIG